MIPNVCCLFFGPHGSLSKEKEIFDSVAWEEGKENLLISASHARTRAPEFLSPSLSKACHSDFLFFLIVHDVVVTCASFLYPHIIERKEINQSILKLCFVLSSFFLPSFLPSFLGLFTILCSFGQTFYFNFSAKPIQCVRQWRASALGMHTTLWFPLQKIKNSPNYPLLKALIRKYKNTFNPKPSEAVKGQHYEIK